VGALGVGWIFLVFTLCAPQAAAAAFERAPGLVALPPSSPRASPTRPPAESNLSKGKFLVASRKLGDPRFMQTVVLLLDYAPGGAMGLIVNRPSEMKLSTLLPETEGLKARKDTVYVGGPVAINQILMLIRAAKQPEESLPVLEDIFVSANSKLLERMVEGAGKGERFRVYAGYAGWAPGQLDGEVVRGDWYVMPADSETVFEQTPAEIWPELIQRVSAQWVRLPGRTASDSARAARETRDAVRRDTGRSPRGREAARPLLTAAGGATHGWPPIGRRHPACLPEDLELRPRLEP
jgi:putative transcriptional regulator